MIRTEINQQVNPNSSNACFREKTELGPLVEFFSADARSRRAWVGCFSREAAKLGCHVGWMFSRGGAELGIHMADAEEVAQAFCLWNQRIVVVLTGKPSARLLPRKNDGVTLCSLFPR